MTQTTERDLEAARERALAALRGGRRFVLVGHQRPDGDCIGSQAAMARLLEILGKDVRVLNPDPPEERFAELVDPERFGVFGGGALPEHDVALLLDFNVLSRTGPMEEPLASAPSTKMVVDHHPLPAEGSAGWWDEAYVDPSAAATGLVVRRIARALGVEPDLRMAQGIFTALATDTGWFRYSNTDAEVLATAAELVELGVVPVELYARIHQRSPMHEPRALGEVLRRTSYHAGGRLAVVDVPLVLQGEMEGVETGPVLDLVRAVQSVEVVLLLREVEKGICRLSARSKSEVDVNLLARRFGGGGHARAAGATIGGELAEVRDRLVAAALEEMRASPAPQER